jgi:hypothetical protein
VPPPPPPAQYGAPFSGSTSAPNIIMRVTNILTKPKEEWPVIAGEATSIAALYSGYIVILAAIPAVAAFIQMTIFAAALFRVGMTAGLMTTILSYALTLGGVYLSAFIVDKLAPSFQSQSNMIQALKLVAYAYTASWVAGIFNVIPFLGILFVIAGGVYSIYLFYLGLPVMMRTPQDKVIIYMIVSAAVIFVISIVIGFVVTAVSAAAFMSGRILG